MQAGQIFRQCLNIFAGKPRRDILHHHVFIVAALARFKKVQLYGRILGGLVCQRGETSRAVARSGRTMAAHASGNTPLYIAATVESFTEGNFVPGIFIGETNPSW